MNSNIIHILMNIAAFILAGSLHEWAHAFSAYIMGDSTARDEGRMTINPGAHVDFLGTILLPLIRIYTGVPLLGWMKPVPVNRDNFRNPSKGMALSAIAGPLSNLFQAAFSLFLMRLILEAGVFFNGKILYSIYDFISLYYMINISLVVFNLLPVPPLDGSKVLRYGLSTEGQIKLDRVSQFGGIVLYILLLSGVFRVVLTPVLSWSFSLLSFFFTKRIIWSFLPLLIILGIIIILFHAYFGSLWMSIRFGKKRGTNSQATALFNRQVSLTRRRNDSLKKTAHLLLRKKKEGTLDTAADRKLLERIEDAKDSFTKLCSTRTIDPDEEKCLDCSYYANCLLRELDVTAVTGEKK